MLIRNALFARSLGGMVRCGFLFCQNPKRIFSQGQRLDRNFISNVNNNISIVKKFRLSTVNYWRTQSHYMNGCYYEIKKIEYIKKLKINIPFLTELYLFSGDPGCQYFVLDRVHQTLLKSDDLTGHR